MTKLVSLPARGAWIEIPGPAVPFAWRRSLPARGAWIEILSKSRLDFSSAVAPRKGSVD